MFGFVALMILFAMASTSHDFWLKHLSPRVWKSLHMLVYVAYALLIAHVVFGAMQSERSVLYPVLLSAGVIGLGSLHLLAGLREVSRPRNAEAQLGVELAGWIDAGRTDAIEDGRNGGMPGAGNASPYSGTATRSRLCRTFARTRAGRSARARSWTGASPARGTATNTGRRTGSRRRRTRRRSRRTRFGSLVNGCT